MPRASRIDAAGALHHIIARGIERRLLFRDDHDRDDFLRRLALILKETATPCYAWALIPNHFHLLLKTGRVPVSQVMRRLLTGYAVSFNRRHRRSGHLFQNRYKSILCEKDPYFLELVRYIHLNPIHAGLVADLSSLEGFGYCGHGPLMGRRANDWQDTDSVLRLYSDGRAVARQRYRRFLAKGLHQGRRDDLTGGGLIRSSGGWQNVKAMRGEQGIQKSDERILGSSTFVEQVLKEADERMRSRCRLKAENVDLDAVMERVCSLMGSERQALFARGKDRKNVSARSLFCYWAVQELGLSQANLVRLLGLSPAGAMLSVQRGAQLAQRLGYQLLPPINERN